MPSTTASPPSRSAASPGSACCAVGRQENVEVALRTAPETPREEITIRARSPFSGATVANLSPALADELQLNNADRGVVILDVADGSYASNLGFKRGDIIVSVNGRQHRIRRTSSSASPARPTAAGAW